MDTTSSLTTVDDPVAHVAAGDRTAFADLYDRSSAIVFGTTLRMLRNRALAEEVTQEVMLEVWRSASRFDPRRGSAHAWLVTMAHRRAIDRVRAEQASFDRDDRVARRDWQRPHDEVAETVEAWSERDRVRQALAALTPRQREAVELAYYGGHTYRELARMLGVPASTLKTRVRDGLERLRVSLADLADEALGATG